MPLELGVWRIDKSLTPLSTKRLDLESRLEDVLDRDIAIANPNWMIVGRQVQTPFGGFADLLALDSVGDLILLELKRDRTEREIVSQVLDYGSWIRALQVDQVASLFQQYRKKYRPGLPDESLDAAFCKRFNVKKMPDEINAAHQLVIVGSEFDPRTERIVNYLSESYGVTINAVFFRVFHDEGREYLTRAWLNDPADLGATATTFAARKTQGDWNGEFYVSFGDEARRSWEDAVKYGFISAGGGTWYTNSLQMLSPGDRVWVNIPGSTGYVGVGIVEEPVKPVTEFTVTNAKGETVPILQAPLQQPNLGRDSDDSEKCEYLVRVKWLKTVSKKEAIKEKGFFGNQNTVAKPKASSWPFTIERLKKRFGISSD